MNNVSKPTESVEPRVSSPGRLEGWVSRLRSGFRSERIFLLLAIYIGIVAGLAVVCFRIAIEWCRLWLQGTAVPPVGWRLIAAPVGAGLVIALLVKRLFPRSRGSGVNQTKAALYIYNGYVPFRTVIGKFICSALAIGSGFSLGPEDPGLQIGAGIASLTGRELDLPRKQMRLIAPVGAAAGLAAAFNAPISAVLFVIEEVIGKWSASVLGAVVLAAVASAVVERWFLGFAPLFRVPPLQGVRPDELLAYAALGVVGGFASLVFAKGIGVLRPILRGLPSWTEYLQPAVAGLCVGLIAYFGFPQITGAGYEFIDQAIHDQYTWQVLGILAGLKILATTISFVSGTPGGMFAPTLFVGAMLGGAVGGVERILLPHLSTSVAAYALVGVGVMFAGFLRAPMTSVFMVFEISGDYSIVLPVILANTIAYLISRTFQPVPLFDMLSRQDGLDLPSMEEERELPVLHVEDAMQPPPAVVLAYSATVGEALNRIADAPAQAFLVRKEGWRWGVVTRNMLLHPDGSQNADTTLDTLADPVDTVHPDQPLDVALRIAQQFPLVPVLHRADRDRLEGVLDLNTILEAYRAAPRDGASDATAEPQPLL